MSKKTAMILSFAVGTLMFTTTAFAEILTKSGYDQGKDALKYTADSFTGKLSSYTVDTSITLKDNGTVISSENSVHKYDLKNNASENTSTKVDGNEKIESYMYRDKSSYIYHNSDQDVYSVTEHNNKDEKIAMSNPFQEKAAGDVEKIADALIGNLKDSVVVTQNADGSKELSGTLSEAQMPALINAVVSYQVKQEFGVYRNPNEKSLMPKITKDVFVKEVKGKMLVDKNGLIQSIMGTGVLLGKDDAGKEHNITFELLGKVNNINSTTVNKPDLTGKKVQKNSKMDNGKVENPAIYVGTYKNNIVLEKDGKLQKIGERILNIEQVSEKNISGKYHEEYLKGWESYDDNGRDYNFSATFDQFPHNSNFEATRANGKKVSGNVNIDIYRHNIHLYPNESQPMGDVMYDYDFQRVFE